jgi:hypothetical protein
MDEKALEARLQEAQSLFTAGRACHDRVDRLLSIGVTVLAAASATALANDVPTVLFAVPIALSLLYALVMQIYSDASAMGIARRRLEDEIARAFDQDRPLIFQTVVAPLRHARADPSIRLSQIAYVAILVAAIVAAVGVNVGQGRPWWAWAAFATSAGYGVWLVAAAVRAHLRLSSPETQEAGTEGSPARTLGPSKGEH